MRTQYGRAVKNVKNQPSGSGTKDPTPRQAWLLKHCSFLYSHIKKRPSTSNLDTVSYFAFANSTSRLSNRNIDHF